MDFLDPKKKRAHVIRLFVGYFLVATALLLASILLLFAAFGYGINRSTGEVIQNGLVFVDAHPQSAKMFINGQDRGQTDGRFVLEAGKYTLELQRENYRPWKRDFILEGGNIVRLVYPFLFPEKLETTDIVELPTNTDMVTESPDRKWIIMHSQNSPRDFRVLDTSTKDLKTITATIPSSVLAGRSGSQKMEMVEWSTDNRHVLLKHSYSGGYDYIMFDRQAPEQSFNVTQLFNKAFTNVTLRDKKFDQFYLHDEETGELMTGSVSNRNLEPVLSGVVSFWPYKDKTVLYTTTKDAPAEKSLLRLKDGQITYTLRELTRDSGYLLNMAEFDGATYVIGSAMSDGKVYIFKNPVEALKRDTTKPLNPAVLMKLEGAQYLSFSNNARFASVQSGSKFAVYDFETEQQYKYDTQLTLPDAQKAKWMDGHRLMLVGSDNKLTIFDYDGLNPQTLVTTNSSYVPMFDRDYNRLYTVSPLVKDQSKQGLVWTDINLGVE